jgi:uncharacterized protein (DUF488 family)
MTLFTIGYEGIDTARFVSLLVEHGVQTVVDVREVPYSRKPGFSKRALAELLAERRLGYVHMVELGCPKAVRDGHREDGNWQRYTERFLEHLGQQEAAMSRLCGLANASSCALLCYEADFNDCHRSMVANAVHEHSGMHVEHIRTTTFPVRGTSKQSSTSLPLPFGDASGRDIGDA